MPFPDDSKVDVNQFDDDNWRLLRDLDYQGKIDSFRAPAGMLTDFASVPRVFVWFLPRYGRYTKAAILHDYLWRELASRDEMSWIDADATFRRANRELGVPFLRRWILWAAVRYGALVKKGGTKHWWREAPRVLLVSVVAIPIVLPPAAVILVALVLFFLVEMVLYGVLRVAEQIRAVIGRPTGKTVNMPRLTYKL